MNYLVQSIDYYDYSACVLMLAILKVCAGILVCSLFLSIQWPQEHFWPINFMLEQKQSLFI